MTRPFSFFGFGEQQVRAQQLDITDSLFDQPFDATTSMQGGGTSLWGQTADQGLPSVVPAIQSSVSPVETATKSSPAASAAMFQQVLGLGAELLGSYFQLSAQKAVLSERAKAIEMLNRRKQQQMARAGMRQIASRLASFGASGFTVGSFGDITVDLLTELNRRLVDIEFETELRRQDNRIAQAGAQQQAGNQAVAAMAQFGQSLLSLEMAKDPDLLKDIAV